MKIIYGDVLPKGLAIALGAFDGIHIGHKKLINNVLEFAKDNNLKSCVFSFDLLPSGAFHITDSEKRIKILEDMGVDYLYIQHFDDKFKNTSAKDFMALFLADAKYISVGFNFRFGKGREGDSETLKEFCNKNGIGIDVADPVCYNGDVVSSTRIRQCIKDADFESVKDMLGYSFFVDGTVVHGKKLGRTIDFPTANIIVKNTQAMPDDGVYITLTEADGKMYKSFTNYGSKPTFDDSEVVLETHLFDFDGDLYGKTIKIYFAKKLRNIRKFASIEDLRNQLCEDKNKSLDFFSKNGLQTFKYVV